MKIITALALAFLLSGCVAFQPTVLQPDGASPREVGVKSISVVNLGTTYETSGFFFGPGYKRMADAEFAMPLAERLRKDIPSIVRASGSREPLDVWVVDVGFYWQSTGADLVPIINIFSVHSSGSDFKCAAQLALRSGASSERVAVENVVTHSTAGIQAGESMYRATAQTCYTGLLAKVAAKLAEMYPVR